MIQETSLKSRTGISPSAKAYCWICESRELTLAKPSNIPGALSSESFAITDSHYGMTAAIYRCANCGFLECPEVPEVLSYYEGLEDTGYEAGRRDRSLQAQKIVETAKRLQPGGRLLDIGAASGILVERALEAGYRAEGIEPSGWLCRNAKERNLPVHSGIFPHPDVRGEFDVITLIDVIEHVSDPLQLLRDIEKQLSPTGIAVVVTPDLGSIMARLLGWKWWHFRVAHIGYFTRRTLFLAFERAGLKPVLVRRPAWYFPADYLWVRLHRYLPRALCFKPPAFVNKIVIPLNLRDSWLVAVARAGSSNRT